MEIERKFLLDDELASILDGKEGKEIVQAYLTKSSDLTVRVRIKGTQGFLTIKGKTKRISREEFEYEIPLLDAQQMISQFSTKHVAKVRYEIPFGNHVWEIDVFKGHLEGLVIAEIELSSEEEEFEKPHWLGREVSDDQRYFNANLIDLNLSDLA